MIKNWQKFYFKNSALLLFLLFIALFPAILMKFRGEDFDNFNLALFVIAIFFVILVLINPLLRLRKFQKVYGVDIIKDEDLLLAQRRKFTCKFSMNELYERIQMDPWFSMQKVIMKKDKIMIKTRWSYFGWGDEIRILPEQPLEQTKSITVQSEPKFYTFLSVDYGTNWENILRIRKLLESDH